MKYTMTLLAAGLTAVLLLLFPNISSAAVQHALRLCAETIIPTLLPFLILSNICLNLRCIRHLSDKSGPVIRKLFHLPCEAATALIFGCLCGFPMGAKTVAELYKEGRLQKNDAEHMLLFCSNAGPSFVFGVVGNAVFQNQYWAAMMWMIHVLSAIVIGILFRPKESHFSGRKNTIEWENTSCYSKIVHAISDAGSTMFQICIMICAFSVLIGYIIAIIPTQHSNSLLYVILIGMIELSTGTTLLSHLPLDTAWLLSAVLLAWNGFCIHFQVLSITSATDLHMHKYFLGKVLHMLLSLLLACAVMPLL